MTGVLAGPFMVAPQGALTLDYLVVGGGGGGATDGGGGGGGGGMLAGTIPLVDSCNFIIGVGGGGAGGGRGSIDSPPFCSTGTPLATDNSGLGYFADICNIGKNGNCSFLCSRNPDSNCFVANGGGAGAGEHGRSNVAAAAPWLKCVATSGGSGGGGSFCGVSRTVGGFGNTPATAPRQGGNGGSGVSGGGGGGNIGFAGGGGGGGVDGKNACCNYVFTGGIIGGCSTNSAIPGGAAGGDGTISCITGTNRYYAGGGAGSTNSMVGLLTAAAPNWPTAGSTFSTHYKNTWPGGQGGGGTGGFGGLAPNCIAPTNGTAGLGGGGGGAGRCPGNFLSPFRGGNGGSGTVILRYKTGGLPVCIVGNPTQTTVGGDTVLCFTSSGSIRFGTSIPQYASADYVVIGGGGSGGTSTGCIGMGVDSGSNLTFSSNSNSSLPMNSGGGGGAGGYISGNINLEPQRVYQISIGAGGAAVGVRASSTTQNTRVFGFPGGFTTFANICATGGGGGAGWSNPTNSYTIYSNGASSGGSGGGGTGNKITTPSINYAIGGQGNCELISGLAGNVGGRGAGPSYGIAGGGGGANGAGGAATYAASGPSVSGGGGAGCTNTSIWPFSSIQTYAAGGAGGGGNMQSAGNFTIYAYDTSGDVYDSNAFSCGGSSAQSCGRLGLGGRGGISILSGVGNSMELFPIPPFPAHEYSWGSGGGGHTNWFAYTNDPRTGCSGSGTSGVVFIKYSAAYPPAVTTGLGVNNYCTDELYRYYRFTGSGTFMLPTTTFTNTYNISTQKSSYQEGEIIIFHIITNGISNGTTISWSQIGTATASDFNENTSSGTATVNNNLASVKFTSLRKFTTTNKTVILQLADGTTSDTIALQGSQQIEYLIIGGGGAGGTVGCTCAYISGGGGAGGVLSGTTTITKPSTCVISVGSGGSGGLNGIQFDSATYGPRLPITTTSSTTGTSEAFSATLFGASGATTALSAGTYIAPGQIKITATTKFSGFKPGWILVNNAGTTGELGVTSGKAKIANTITKIISVISNGEIIAETRDSNNNVVGNKAGSLSLTLPSVTNNIDNYLATNGSPSSAFGITALGGGRGGSSVLWQCTNLSIKYCSLEIFACSGGSGGGQPALNSVSIGNCAGAPGTSGQGNSGSLSLATCASGSANAYYKNTGAGGGAGRPALSINGRLDAAPAQWWSLNLAGLGTCQYAQWAEDTASGEQGYFASGGASGGNNKCNTFVPWMLGGGGASNRSPGGRDCGLPNTGGGGGGGVGGLVPPYTNSRNGGSGIVIVRYCGTVAAGTGGTIYCKNGYVYHKFTASGSLVI